MVAFDWAAKVEIETLDGRTLGPATLRLTGSLPEEGSEHWAGELSGAVCAGAKCWPDYEPVRLRVASGDTAIVRLETGTCEVGPVLEQVAHVHADPEQLKALVAGSLE
jgi:hypothetical protein